MGPTVTALRAFIEKEKLDILFIDRLLLRIENETNELIFQEI